MAKKSVKKVSREFAQGELVDNILAPCITDGAYDESTGSYPAFKGFDTRELYQAGNLPDLSRSSPAREVTFVCFDFTEFECLETLHDPKSDVENSGRDFYAHVHKQSLALEKLISEVRKVLVHLTGVLSFFWSIGVFWGFQFSIYAPPSPDWRIHRKFLYPFFHLIFLLFTPALQPKLFFTGTLPESSEMFSHS